jgi:hypothetical protein
LTPPVAAGAQEKIFINLNDITLCQVVKKEKDIRWLRTSVRREEEQTATRKSSVTTTFFI